MGAIVTEKLTADVSAEQKLSELASEIKELRGQAQRRESDLLVIRWEMGRRLLAAKEIFCPGGKHGGQPQIAFGRWAKREVGFSQNMRHSLMRVATIPREDLPTYRSFTQAIKAVCPAVQASERTVNARRRATKNVPLVQSLARRIQGKSRYWSDTSSVESVQGALRLLIGVVLNEDWAVEEAKRIRESLKEKA